MKKKLIQISENQRSRVYAHSDGFVKEFKLREEFEYQKAWYERAIPLGVTIGEFEVFDDERNALILEEIEGSRVILTGIESIKEAIDICILFSKERPIGVEDGAPMTVSDIDLTEYMSFSHGKIRGNLLYLNNSLGLKLIDPKLNPIPSYLYDIADTIVTPIKYFFNIKKEMIREAMTYTIEKTGVNKEIMEAFMLLAIKNSRLILDDELLETIKLP